MSGGFYNIQKDVLSEVARVALVQGVCKSEFLGASPLGEEFINTQGFSIVFKKSALDEMFQRFKYLEPILLASIFEGSNAFYVNPLVLNGMSKVKPHIDCRLLSPQDIRIIPNLVSVFYAEVSPLMDGGTLVLNTGKSNEVCVLPQANSMVFFRGDVVHRVSEVTNLCRRISIVCEQYNLEEELLVSFPDLQVITSNDFAPRVREIA